MNRPDVSRADVDTPDLSAAAPATPISVASPLPGRLIPLGEVPDPVFAKGLAGGGAAVVPDDDAGVLTAVAPLDGRVIKVMPTRTSFSMPPVRLCWSTSALTRST